ncbi:tRNA lysidine(34) synthetase TilS [Acuticoccus mangrovi]|uniref:tRNA(Ile)-lysidine synthase n=1 Tax=Acuticoccus mangrovi TaxID=2796142 RepID=A0A934IHQ7_9HYPH|nr:tRNA lysidine(34) synthetase TilS [Acuticoccus mangrovi]MBJ3776929.1 tRNA lysidine(34) synthetase TilS [Acuticoccus mangrovi]
MQTAPGRLDEDVADPAAMLDIDLFPAAGRIGLAVSGGGDSTAMAVLAAEALPTERLAILTVDHGLRPDAAADVTFVERLGARLGVPVAALKVDGPPSGSVQAWARAERYRLFGEAAGRLDLAAIATAHTLEDQAETLLLRLARGSGLKGLGAIRPVARRDGLTIVRPLLGVRREALRAALVARGIGWREDPSNTDPRFDRVAMRRLAPRLAAVGLTAERLAATAAHLARAGEVIEADVAALAARLRTDRAGAVRLPLPLWRAAPEEVRLRVLADMVCRAGGLPQTPRFAPLRAAADAVSRGVGASLGRAALAVAADDIVAWREPRAIAPITLAGGERGVFDGRFSVELARGFPRVSIAAIGESVAKACPAIAHRPAIATAPGIFLNDRLVLAPTLGVRRRDFPADGAIVRPMR